MDERSKMKYALKLLVESLAGGKVEYIEAKIDHWIYMQSDAIDEYICEYTDQKSIIVAMTDDILSTLKVLGLVDHEVGCVVVDRVIKHGVTHTPLLGILHRSEILSWVDPHHVHHGHMYPAIDVRRDIHAWAMHPSLKLPKYDEVVTHITDSYVRVNYTSYDPYTGFQVYKVMFMTRYGVSSIVGPEGKLYPVDGCVEHPTLWGALEAGYSHVYDYVVEHTTPSRTDGGRGTWYKFDDVRKDPWGNIKRSMRYRGAGIILTDDALVKKMDAAKLDCMKACEEGGTISYSDEQRKLIEGE